jgi:DNA-binding IclR family transcriptional regulator
MAILECLSASRRGLNLSEISRKLQIPKSSVYPILLTLEGLGFAVKEPGKGVYRLGAQASRLARSGLGPA